MSEHRDANAAPALGWAAVAFSALYLLSDVIEAVQGGFSPGQLWLTLVAEAAIPFVVIGLYRAQRPRIGPLGRVGAFAYAYAYVYFTGTVVYALVEHTPDYADLSDHLQPSMTIHGAIMVLAGMGFGIGVIRAGVLPRWTGVALMAGVVLVALTQNAPEGVQLLAAGVRALAFAGMGACVVSRWKPATGLWERADGAQCGWREGGDQPSTYWSVSMSRPFRLAGIVAGLVLVAFGIGAVVIGITGRHEVSTDVKREQIVGTPDMKPSLIAKAAQEAGLKNVALPTCNVAGKAITNGGDAKCFAEYMRIHALEATGGKTYAQMPQFATADGKGTSEAAQALKDPKTGAPTSNPSRQVWISETALSTALNTSFFAASVGLFAIVMGIALLLSGIGFLVLALGLLGTTGLRKKSGGDVPLGGARPAAV